MIFSKKNTRFSVMGMLAAVFTAGCLLTGCGKAEDDAKNAAKDAAKYFHYTKKGNAKTGYYIAILGLNVECNESGKLVVDLDEIVSKHQGKLVIPSEIDGIPVKEVNLDSYRHKMDLATDFSGTPVNSGPVSLIAVTDSDGMKYYLANDGDYYKYISEIVIPEGVESVDLDSLSLKELTLPASVSKFSASDIQGKLTMHGKALKGADLYSAEELVVIASDDTPVTEEVSVRARKSAVIPNNFKKIDLSYLFAGATASWDKQYRIKSECKGFKLTCAPDAEIVFSGRVESEIRRNLSALDCYVNDGYLQDKLK